MNSFLKCAEKELITLFKAANLFIPWPGLIQNRHPSVTIESKINRRRYWHGPRFEFDSVRVEIRKGYLHSKFNRIWIQLTSQVRLADNFTSCFVHWVPNRNLNGLDVLLGNSSLILSKGWKNFNCGYLIKMFKDGSFVGRFGWF